MSGYSCESETSGAGSGGGGGAGAGGAEGALLERLMATDADSDAGSSQHPMPATQAVHLQVLFPTRQFIMRSNFGKESILKKKTYSVTVVSVCLSVSNI